MRVCDRHPAVRSHDQITIKSTDVIADLCPECMTLINEFLGRPENKTIAPEKKRSILGLGRKNPG
jgi:hypothetical protein